MSTQKTKIEYEIKPPKGLVNFNFPEIWRYKELLYVFAWRDIKVRYKQTAIGALWAIFQPFITMIIFTVFFGGLAKVPSDGIPYPIFVYTGLLFWNYFSTALTNASNCLIENENIVKKVYFPRLILPISTTVTPLIDFGFALLILFGLMFYYHFTPTFLGIILIPVLLLVSMLTASGLGFFLSSVNAKYRDVRYALPFFIQIMMYVTPVIYSVSIIPQRFHWIAYLNPMTGVISTARAMLLGTGSIDTLAIIMAPIVTIAIFFLGLVYFRKTERFFADIL